MFNSNLYNYNSKNLIKLINLEQKERIYILYLGQVKNRNHIFLDNFWYKLLPSSSTDNIIPHFATFGKVVIIFCP